MEHGHQFGDIRVSNEKIIDGHHRYISALLAGINIGVVPSHSTSATRVFSWPVVVFTDAELDTDAKIRKLNEDDALFNNISLERILDMTK